MCSLMARQVRLCRKSYSTCGALKLHDDIGLQINKKEKNNKDVLKLSISLWPRARLASAELGCITYVHDQHTYMHAVGGALVGNN